MASVLGDKDEAIKLGIICDDLQIPRFRNSLLKSLTEGVNIRFASQMIDPGLLLAAISHPCFKLDWLDNEEEKESAKSKLRMAVLAINNETVITSQENNDSALPKHSFFSWAQRSEASAGTNAIDRELLLHFSTPAVSLDNNYSLQCLKNTPSIEAIFLKFNTPLPSSAPVERLFSIAGCVYTKKRGRLTDGNFEKVLLYKYNKKFK